MYTYTAEYLLSIQSLFMFIAYRNILTMDIITLVQVRGDLYSSSLKSILGFMKINMIRINNFYVIVYGMVCNCK